MKKNKKGALLMYGLMAGLIGGIIVLIIHSGSKTEFNIVFYIPTDQYGSHKRKGVT